ncbi:Cysteine dioxygenase type I [Bathymodiolus heckerae thiotrophic gill symbiont]|uniref:hypothetical protein n=1 Tax=Bathymodiolus heckerae thiotrophic gill symbiont TaxID=1052212 RepID=UPI0010B4736F|nr:hypothetical protein [Bathymodiolus heckerae thiotrophic gill symbiont]SHN89913.1 Cysteine dioxygenase type I [Bathymodiolus heckerae thiotrophic gill symbiont]
MPLKEIQNYNYKHSTDFDFENLCELLAAENYNLTVEKIQTLEVSALVLPFSEQSYTKSIIVDNKQYWLGLLNWDKNATTCIHGHPDFAFVYLISGQLSCKIFDKNPLIARQSTILNQGEYQYNKGIKGKMDNYIHQISAKEKSLSLHFYSDNPSKGEVFDF